VAETSVVGGCRAKRALIVRSDAHDWREARLVRVVEFLGVPAVSTDVANVETLLDDAIERRDSVVFVAAKTLAALRALPVQAAAIREAAAIYVYGHEDRAGCEAALRSLGLRWGIQSAPAGLTSVRVSDTRPDLTGPMRGIAVPIALTRLDSIVIRDRAADCAATLITAGEHELFLQFDLDGVPAFFNASAAIVNIDEPVSNNHYDVKGHFASVVPLLLFLRWAFPSVMWRPNETGACLIIDDPLLRRRYGFCDFRRLRELMSKQGFTTNVAFIPWNWRRTSAKSSQFFRDHSDSFSVSVHGCDHVAAEFGTVSEPLLECQTRLALSRMRRHYGRTGIRHEPIMVFPQGVFSSVCPEVLKRNGFVAAVNTEISPIDGPPALIRDVWDTALLRHGCFSVFTRRYAHHGIENFAFDALLGKPCFIVAHHDFFRDDGATLTTLVSQLSFLVKDLRWRSPLEVIRRSYRCRDAGDATQVEMYGTEIVVTNRAADPVDVHLTKKECDPEAVVEVAVDGKSVPWRFDSERIALQHRFRSRSEAVVSISYAPRPDPAKQSPIFKSEVLIAGRRLLSELRDEVAYLGRAITR
jgi:hypothetical protein